MYSVVLIDDENIILEGLKNIVAWKQFDCEIVGTANDAVSGVKLIRKKCPDILFTDIRMPGMDGLSMISELRQDFPDMQIAILTGYRDFAYAQEAIRLGVTRFLLKPSKMNEINEALAAMKAKLDILPDSKREMPSSVNFIVTQALRFMESEYASRLSLQEVADHCFVSQWHLSKLLNRFEGKSFYDILNDIRIRHAKELLENKELKISEISEMTGYTDSAHFARIFRKLTGVSANEYRNTLR